MDLWLGAALLGVTIGVSMGMLGGGGSILALPALVYLLGQPVREAVSTSLLVVGGSAAAGAVAHLRGGTVPWRSAAMFGTAGITGSFAGGWVGQRIPEDALLIGFAALMLIVAALMLRRKPSQESNAAKHSCENAWRERPAMVLVVGSSVGVLTGLFGVGGGFILVPAWTLAMGCPVRVSVGASLLVIGMTSVGALASHAGSGPIDAQVAVPFALAGIVGAVAGQRSADRISGTRLSAAFGYLVIAVAVFVLVQVFWLDAAST